MRVSSSCRREQPEGLDTLVLLILSCSNMVKSGDDRDVRQATWGEFLLGEELWPWKMDRT